MNNLDKTRNVNLIALNFSTSLSLDGGEQRWLITDASDHQAIRENKYKTDESLHNGWLPWLDQSQPEFAVRSAYGVYKTTRVAPLAQAKIYSRSAKQYVPDPIAVHKKMQKVYDLIAPLVMKLKSGEAKLFAHMVLKNNVSFTYLVFEIFADGKIVGRELYELQDIAQLLLPSALSLGL